MYHVLPLCHTVYAEYVSQFPLIIITIIIMTVSSRLLNTIWMAIKENGRMGAMCCFRFRFKHPRLTKQPYFYWTTHNIP